MLKVSIYGIGNFGFALLKHLSKKQASKNTFALYAYDSNRDLVDHLRAKRTHLLHHSSVRISKSVIFTGESKELVIDSDILVLAISSDAIRQVVTDLKQHINRKLIMLNTAKALDGETGLRFSVLISDCLKDIRYPLSIAMLAGGTIARDLFKHEPLGVDIASHDKRTLKLLGDIFTTDNLNVYTTTDLAGVEYAAAFKNVIAILAGMMKGLGFSYGSETHMISRAAREVKELVATSLGGKDETFSIESQCWGNDLWMSCTGNTRNREFGILLGRGYEPEKAMEKMKGENKTVEGVNTVRVIGKLIENNVEDFPILRSIGEIVVGGRNPRSTIIYLMSSNKI